VSMKVMTDEWVAELRRLEAAATKGPWRKHGDGYSVMGDGDISGYAIADDVDDPADVALIVAMRNALPELLAMLDELRKKNRAINAEHVRQELSWNAKLANAEAALREIRVEVPSERYGRNHADMDGLVVRLRKIDEIARVALAEKEKS